MTDLKQKEEQAWSECRIHLDGSVPPIRAAVHASIEAALAPVLERVARLEKSWTAKAMGDAFGRIPVPCETCSCRGFVCGNRGWLKPCVNDNCRCERRPCPDCSKPAASTEGDERDWEGEAVNSRGGLGTDVTQNIPQSVPQAPERIRLQFRGGTPFIGGTLQPALNVSDAEYVRADVHAKACIDSRRLGEEHVRLLDERGDFTEGSRPWRCEKELEKARTALASAERRIAELEGNNAAIQADLADFTNAAFANGRAEGREAGVREAAEVCIRYAEHVSREAWLEMTPVAKKGLEYVATRIALLAKKPEVSP